MTRATSAIFASAPLALLAFSTFGCNPYNPDLGNTPFQCGSSDPVCPEGYFCSPGPQIDVCIKGDEARPDASTQFVCADDGTLEPNDMANRAFVTPIPSAGMSYPLNNLAICPAGADGWRPRSTTHASLAADRGARYRGSATPSDS